MKTFFEVPTQVRFRDEDSWCVGIAYRDEIICACCGGVVSIEEVYEFSHIDDPIRPYDNWINFSEEIFDN